MDILEQSYINCDDSLYSISIRSGGMSETRIIDYTSSPDVNR